MLGAAKIIHILIQPFDREVVVPAVPGHQIEPNAIAIAMDAVAKIGKASRASQAKIGTERLGSVLLGIVLRLAPDRSYQHHNRKQETAHIRHAPPPQKNF